MATDKGMKKSLRIVAQVIIDLVIVFILVQGFTYAYNFAYQVFSETAVNPKSDTEIVFVVQPDSSTLEIVENLKEQGLVEDKYVMLAKIYLTSYHGKIMPGEYRLSKSMTQGQILDVISSIDKQQEEDE